MSRLEQVLHFVLGGNILSHIKSRTPLLNIPLIIAVFVLAVSNTAFANQLIDCTGCTSQQFPFAAMDARDGVHVVYDLKARISRKFSVHGVDCDNRSTLPSADQKIVASAQKCWSGGATVTEMPVDGGVKHPQ